MEFLSSIGDERWADMLGTVSLLSAAGFGLLALLTDYKKGGKITRWGRIAVGGIVLSTILSIMSGVVQDRIAAKSASDARDRRKIEDDQFVEQVNRMQSLGAAMRTANANGQRLLTQMRTSLVAQRDVINSQGILLTNAEHSIRLTTRLAAQEQGDTLRLLERTWAEGNRIGGGSIMVAVAYHCSLDPEHFVTLLPAQAVAELTIRSSVPGVTTLGQLNASNPISVFSIDHQITRLERPSDQIPYQQISRFTPFLFNEGFGDLQDPRHWANMSVEVEVNGLQPDLAGSLIKTTPVEIDPISELRRNPALFGSGAEAPPHRAWIMPCTARMALHLNGHEVAMGLGRVVLVQASASDTSGHMIIRLPPAPVDMHDFPSFSVERQPARSARVAPRVRR